MPAVTEAAVLDALRPIVDPDFGKSIVELGFVKKLRIEGGRVSFDDRAHHARLPGEGASSSARRASAWRRCRASTRCRSR